jgi:hypothetical protein
MGAPAASYRTANFVVTAPTRRCAQLVAEAAEHQRREQALRWLGKELPDWPELCRVTVNLPNQTFLPAAAPLVDAHATCLRFENNKVASQEMQLQGELERILATHVPHEVTHCVLAHHFRAPVPRWADEGAAMLAEDDEEQQRHEKQMRRLIDTPERIIHLARLLPMADYPRDVMALYGEGYSLARFLVQRKDRPTFLAFVATGMRGDWNRAVRQHYDIANVNELEKKWLESLEQEEVIKAQATDELSRPVGPQPITGLASLDRQGRLVLRIRGAVATPVTERIQRGGSQEIVTRYVLAATVQESIYDVLNLEVYDLEGLRVEPKALATALARETPVLVATDGRKVDRYHLQLIKKGTLILVPPPTPPQAPPPVVSGN